MTIKEQLVAKLKKEDLRKLLKRFLNVEGVEKLNLEVCRNRVLKELSYRQIKTAFPEPVLVS